ncbi:MAG: hypothetical protein A3G93_15165 [Nitrospinae bacterium RIFCSPLOWO2_12_FULL_45_22]|nr:MAG: hypothetical protein A3G93_15165 [Nitrospinae bacterium RIFCSPLOWO2_12_FULL_45_22]
MHYPSVSVVIITYNEERNIGGCLESVLSIEYLREKYEVIVVDSSIDATSSIVKRYPGVKLINSPEKNFALSRNIGVAHAQYNLIAFTDADCRVPKDWLRILVGNFNNGEIAGVGGNAYPPPGSKYLGKCIACLGLPAGGAIGLDAHLKEVDGSVNTLSTCNAIFKKEAIIGVGGFDERLIYGCEDEDIINRMREKGLRVKYDINSYVFHNTRDNIWDFFKWSFRRGIADYNVRQPSILKITRDPFSLLWPLIGISVLTLLGSINLMIIPLSLLLLYFLLLGGMFLGTKKFRLLISRRKKIKIDLVSIFSVIPALFYLRRVGMNAGKMWGRVRWS